MDRSFLGTGWKFPVQVDPYTGRMQMSSEEADIEEAIKVIIWTPKGERVMRPDFGCGIHDFVFASTDATTLRLLETTIIEALRKWEPRIDQIRVDITPDKETDGHLQIDISYAVRSTNNLFNLVFPFYINEGSK